MLRRRRQCVRVRVRAGRRCASSGNLATMFLDQFLLFRRLLTSILNHILEVLDYFRICFLHSLLLVFGASQLRLYLFQGILVRLLQLRVSIVKMARADIGSVVNFLLGYFVIWMEEIEDSACLEDRLASR